jgi:hypothetical protein
MQFAHEDWLDIATLRNQPVFNKIMADTSELFMNQILDEYTMAQIFNHAIYKINQAIDAGEFKAEIISPDSRIVKFRGLRISQAKDNPSAVIMAPIWAFEDEEEEEEEWV